MSTSTRSKRSLLADGSWHDGNGLSSETFPFLNRRGGQRSRKTSFFRPRPLWLVPFVVASSFVRGMTLAPRLQIYTQLSCSNLRAVRTAVDSGVPKPYPSTLVLPHNDVGRNYNSTTVIFSAPLEAERSHRRARTSCASDLAVQAGAVRFQMMMTSIVGFLSAFTSGSWGAFSERYGRTMVLAISTLGLLLTDLIFVLVSTLAIPLSRHGHNLLILAPIIEGLLGGISTLQAATSSYISDCVSSSSRVQVFSRFAGLYYVGFLLGPLITNHHVPQPSANPLGGRVHFGSEKTDLSIFWIAIACSFINFLLALLVFPESLGKEWREQTKLEDNKFRNIAAGMGSIQQPEIAVVGTEGNTFRFPVNGQGAVRRFLKPLIVFWPVQVLRTSRKRRDWNLTLLAGGLFFYMLSTGIFQLRYLYATHTYDWGVHQLSYYISYMGSLRVVFLLVLFPAVIAVFKQNRAGAGTAVNNNITAGKKLTLDSSVVKSKTQPIISQLGRELALTRFSLLIDIVAHSLVVIMPAPAMVQHMGLTGHQNPNPSISQTVFIVASTLSCFGVGSMPAAQSLALSLFQLRGAKNPSTGPKKIARTGELFGAIAMLQAIGQTVLALAPIAFGSTYTSSESVARFPKAIFVSGAVLCMVAYVTISFVKGPVVKNSTLFKSQAPTQRKRGVREFERGRSRVSKDLRGGAIPCHPRGPSYGTIVNEFTDASERV